MTTVLLIRHGRTTANADGTLAGWTPGVHLDDLGNEQAAALAARLSAVVLTAVLSSPLDRCQQTAQALTAQRELTVQLDDDLGEVRYGDWTGQPLKSLSREPLWKVVQQHPSAVTFPGDDGEGLAAMQARAVAAMRRWNAELGSDAVVAVVSHGDVIKALLADALGMHLDLFQRITVDPASLSVVRYTSARPFVERINDGGGDVTALLPKKRRRKSAKSDDAVVGGGAGPDTRPTRSRRRTS